MAASGQLSGRLRAVSRGRRHSAAVESDGVVGGCSDFGALPVGPDHGDDRSGLRSSSSAAWTPPPGPCAGVTLASCREPDAVPTVLSKVWRGNIRTFEI